MHFLHLHHYSPGYGVDMNITDILSTLHHGAEQLSQLMADTPPAEIVVAVALILLALLAGILVNRHVDAKPKTTLPAHAIDSVAPLLAPVLASAMLGIAVLVFKHLGFDALFLPLVAKLCVAWLAIRAIVLMSSGKTATLFIALLVVPITLLHLFDLWDPTTAFLNDIVFTIGGQEFNLYHVIRAAVALVLLFWAVSFILGVTDSRLKRVRNLRASNRTLIMKFTQIGVYIIAFMFALQVVGVSLTALSIFSGAIGVGIGFGLQKIASNFISGIILLFEKSIEVGDIVELEKGVTGTVALTSGRFTMVTTPDGKDVMIPNEEFITQRVTSLTHSNKRGRIDVAVGVGYDSDIELALKLLCDAARTASRCAKDPAPAAFATGFGDSAINLQLYFWVENVAEGVLQPKTEAIIAILKLFAKHNIVIPYPHQVAVLPGQVGEHLEYPTIAGKAMPQKSVAKPKADKA
jgi:small-conductance mechanosensitive channel